MSNIDQTSLFIILNLVFDILKSDSRIQKSFDPIFNLPTALPAANGKERAEELLSI
jgi:hypothetical protein